jgi:hypothetical protein
MGSDERRQIVHVGREQHGRRGAQHRVSRDDRVDGGRFRSPSFRKPLAKRARPARNGFRRHDRTKPGYCAVHDGSGRATAQGFGEDDRRNDHIGSTREQPSQNTPQDLAGLDAFHGTRIQHDEIGRLRLGSSVASLRSTSAQPTTTEPVYGDDAARALPA